MQTNLLEILSAHHVLCCKMTSGKNEQTFGLLGQVASSHVFLSPS